MKYGIAGGLRRSSIVLPLAVLIFLSGCNWGKGRTLQQPTVSISVLSAASTVTLGHSVTITATVYDLSNQGATWSFSPLSFGALSNQTPTSVTYTAPTEFTVPTTVTIVATSVTNPTISSSVNILASPITVTLSGGDNGVLAPETINQGTQLFLQAFVLNDLKLQGVTWSLSPANGTGSLLVTSKTGVTYTAPATVSGPTQVTITATSVENTSVSTSVPITILASGGGPNVVTINVDGGPVPGQVHPNAAFTSVTLCNPGSATACQTIGGILVDTGSYGLRILQSEIPLLKLSKQVDGNGNILENCAATRDGNYLWGPVSHADLYIGGETASSFPLQVISNVNTPVPATCSNGGTANENTPELLGANGILGIGPEPTDCTVAGVDYCNGSVQATPRNLYYACPSAGCATTDSAIIVTSDLEVANPVPLIFSGDKNGVILQLPPVSAAQPTVSGFLIFGIGTQTNNLLGSASVFTLDSNDHFTTLYNGQTLTSSSLDSGANALYFPDTLPICSANIKFFCPSSTTGLSAVIQGATQGQSTVNFSVDNADSLLSANPGAAVFGTLAGPIGTYNACSQGNLSCTFDWGLPFFYGRSVYVAIDGQRIFGAPPPPWYAY